MAIEETLRMYPPAWIGPRRAIETFEFAGHTVPGGMSVNYCSWASHHLPDVFAEPEAFRPERFAPGARERIPKGAYVPFGGGSRTCIGMRFGQAEIRALATLLLQRFSPRATPRLGDGHPPDADALPARRAAAAASRSPDAGRRVSRGRDHRRVPVGIKGTLRFEVTGATRPVTVVDLSAGGMLLECEQTLSLGRALWVRVALQDGPLDVRARVVHSAQPYRAGVEFERLDVTTAGRLAAYVDARVRDDPEPTGTQGTLV